MLALIDGDIVAYRCAATAEGDTEAYIPFSRVDTMVEEILQAVQADSYKVFLSGDRNFRKDIYPLYKANREGKPRPKWLKDCKAYLVKEWQASVTDGIEADDALGIEQTKHTHFISFGDVCPKPEGAWYTGMTSAPDGYGTSVVCSIDKDLLQVPGMHYNFVKREKSIVNKENALRTFYTQLLVGDPTDNVAGCPGIGKTKAPKLLDGCETDEEMFDSVRAAYKNDKLMKLYGQLLWVWRKENDIWTHPRFELTEGTPLEVVQQ